jgi:hypothetical protein
MTPQKIHRLFDFIDYLNERMLKEKDEMMGALGSVDSAKMI